MENQDHITSVPSQNAPSRAELEQHLRARAWKDNVFRHEFLTNPKVVLERDYAQYFPDGKIPSALSIKVIEEEEQAICFVLPLKLSQDQLDELADIEDEELLGISGGGCSYGVYTWRKCMSTKVLCFTKEWACRPKIKL